MQVKIGTRKSKLALWQAEQLHGRIESLGLKSTLVFIDSQGDIDKTSNFGSFNQTGIFTKALDDSLLAGEIDLAIHSLKDYPTCPPEGISVASTGKRENPKDILVSNVIEKSISSDRFKIGTGSVRRKAQWKYKYPKSEFVNLRGNVPTRLEKLWDSDWDGIIMAYAGMKRLQLIDENCTELDWMIPAPAQGVMGISFRSKDPFITKVVEQLKDPKVELCSSVERKFLNLLEGGCSAPIGALAQIKVDELVFKGSLHNPNGYEAYFVTKSAKPSESMDLVQEWVNEILNQGGDKIMDKIKK